MADKILYYRICVFLIGMLSTEVPFKTSYNKTRYLGTLVATWLTSWTFNHGLHVF